MNEILNWFEKYPDRSLAAQIGIPVLYLLAISLLAFLLWAASKIARQEQFSYLRALVVAAIEAVAMTGAAWGLLSALGGSTIASLGTTDTQIPFNAIIWPINLVLVTGLLLLLGPMSILRALYTWAAHFVLVAHVGCLAAGLGCVGLAIRAGIQNPGGFASETFTLNITWGSLLLLGALSGVILWMACALASAEKLTFLLCLPLAWAKTAVLVGIYFLGGTIAEDVLSDLDTVERMLVLGGVILLVDLVLVMIGTILVGRISLLRGFMIWLLEKPLYVLLAALAVGIDMVGLGIYQTAQSPEGAEVLEYVGIGLLIATAAAVLIYVSTSVLTPSVGAPRRSAA